MADIAINGTSGNDVIQVGSGGSTLTLLVSGTIAEGVWPTINILVNGAVVLADVSVMANHKVGATQLVMVAIPPGTTVTSVGIQYTNDPQVSYLVEDRNVYLSSVELNGVDLPISSSTYFRTFNSSTIAGQTSLLWGGTLTYAGAAVESAAATPGPGGSVAINGLAGIDTAVFSGTRASYSFGHTADGHTVGTTELVNVERLQFADTKVALDMTGHAGTTAGLISALFGASYLGVKEYVGTGLDLLDGGMSDLQLAAVAVQTTLFQQLAGSTSHTDFVRLVYRNVVGFDPSQESLDFYVSRLNSGSETQASLALLAARTAENAVHLVGVMENGIEYS